MRNTAYSLLLALMWLAASGPAETLADSFYNGYTADGYTFNDGYWWRNDSAYTRNLESYYYYDGCRKCRANRYIYKQHHQKDIVKVIEKVKEPYPVERGPVNEGWRKDLLEMANLKLKYQYELQQSQQEQKEYLETVQALGLGQPAGYPQAYQPQVYPQQQGQYVIQGSHSYFQGPLAQQGTSVYGYDSVASVYPDVDLKVLYNQANNLALGLQTLTGQSTQGFQELVSQKEANMAEVARIIARGQAAAQVLEMLKDQPLSTKTKSEFTIRQDRQGSWKLVPGSDPGALPPDDLLPGQPPPEPVPPQQPVDLDAASAQQLKAVIQTRCAACHDATAKMGGLDMTNFLDMPDGRKREIVGRLVTDDPAKLMPKAADGGPAQEPLPLNEITLFFRAAGLSTE
jgi:hypothetical protein